MRTRSTIVAALLAVLAITLPFFAAFLMAGNDRVWTGFLLNPADGASYLAKMQLGLAGSWRFTLLYTAESSPGAYMFLFYLFLGHIARITQLDLRLVFHLARLAGALCLLWSMLRAAQISFAGQPARQRFAFWLLTFGAGLGWTVVLFGLLPMDFWVAEAYPFLAMFSNPHFPLGLALLLWLLIEFLQSERPARLVGLLLGGGLLAIILPFAVVVLLLVAGIVTLWNWVVDRRLRWLSLAALGGLGGPLLLYQYIATLRDPLLDGWNQQNLTLTPSIGDLLLSFSPVLPLALFAMILLVRRKEQPDPIRRVWMIWALLALVLAYSPLALQRRFLLGWYLPLGFLAVDGVFCLREQLASRRMALARWIAPLTLLLALPSTFLLLLITMAGAAAQAPQLYLSKDEATALDWARQNTPAQAVLLASPELGVWVPALSGRRVVYGHPFETVDAEAMQARVEMFYADPGWTDPHRRLIAEKGVAYVLFGPRELALGGEVDPSELEPVFATGTVRIYRVP